MWNEDKTSPEIIPTEMKNIQQTANVVSNIDTLNYLLQLLTEATPRIWRFQFLSSLNLLQGQYKETIFNDEVNWSFWYSFNQSRRDKTAYTLGPPSGFEPRVLGPLICCPNPQYHYSKSQDLWFLLVLEIYTY